METWINVATKPSFELKAIKMATTKCGWARLRMLLWQC